MKRLAMLASLLMVLCLQMAAQTWEEVKVGTSTCKTIMTNITFIGIMGAILSSDKYSHKYKFSVKHKFYCNVGR